MTGQSTSCPTRLFPRTICVPPTGPPSSRRIPPTLISRLISLAINSPTESEAGCASRIANSARGLPFDLPLRATRRHSAMPVSAEKDLAKLPCAAMVIRVIEVDFSATVRRASFQVEPLNALSGSTNAMVPPRLTFRSAKSRKSAASPALPVPRGALPRIEDSDACISRCVALSVPKAANAALPIPTRSPSCPPDRVKGGS